MEERGQGSSRRALAVSRLGHLLAEELREEEEVVVVAPHGVAVLVLAEDGVGEELVGALVGDPLGLDVGRLVEARLEGERDIVEERPEDVVAVAVVVHVHLADTGGEGQRG